MNPTEPISRPVFWLDLTAIERYAGGVAAAAGRRGEPMSFEAIYGSGGEGLRRLYGELVAAGVVRAVGAAPGDLVIEDEQHPPQARLAGTGSTPAEPILVGDLIEDGVGDHASLQHEISALADRLVAVANMAARDSRLAQLL